ncbi:MAG: hypothetical protein NE330_07385 [Lentisphaeraceae bacterium]|nr:hypothetical protein [Lentisphaeraceae bacterium]
MGLFNKRAVGLCWNTKGECFGVVIAKKGNAYSVVSHWSEKSSSNAGGVAATLPSSTATLGIKEEDVVIAGEMGIRCSFVDVKMPPITPKEMKQSLTYSIGSYFPVNPDNLHWSFKISSDKSDNTKSTVRVMAMKNDYWDDWIDAVGTIKIDQLIPPVAVVDTVIDTPVFIFSKTDSAAGEEGRKGFVLAKDEEGLLKVSPSLDIHSEDCFGAGEDPLEFDSLDLGPIENLKESTQQNFSQAILLALHGLETNLKQDKETTFPIPKSMAPKRNVLTSTICSALAVYLLALGIFQVSRYIGTRKKEANSIKTETVKILDGAKKIAIDAKKLEELQEIRTEIEEKLFKPASPKDVLSLITANLPDEYYLTSFQFRGDKATCKVKTSDPAASPSQLFNIFKKVDFFEDDVQVDENSRDITLVLNVLKKPVAEVEP